MNYFGNKMINESFISFLVLCITNCNQYDVFVGNCLSDKMQYRSKGRFCKALCCFADLIVMLSLEFYVAASLIFNLVALITARLLVPTQSTGCQHLITKYWHGEHLEVGICQRQKMEMDPDPSDSLKQDAILRN